MKNTTRICSINPAEGEAVKTSCQIRDWLDLVKNKVILPYDSNRGGPTKPYAKDTANGVCNHLNTEGINEFALARLKNGTFMIADGHSRTQGLLEREEKGLMLESDYEAPMNITVVHENRHYTTYRTYNAHVAHTGTEKVINPDGAFGKWITALQAETGTVVQDTHALTIADFLVTSGLMKKGIDMRSAAKLLQSGRSVVGSILKGDTNLEDYTVGTAKIKRAYQFAFSVLNACSKYKFQSSAQYNKIRSSTGLVTYLMLSYLTGNELANAESTTVDDIGLAIMGNTSDVLALSKLVSKRNYSELKATKLVELHEILSSSSKEHKKNLKALKSGIEQHKKDNAIKELPKGTVKQDITKKQQTKIKFSFV